MERRPATLEENRTAALIVHSAYAVHRALGPGLLENVYEICFCHELTKRGVAYRRQVLLPITYDSIVFDQALRIDVLVEERIICELKAVQEPNALFLAQLLTQLKLANKTLGFLINFNVPTIKAGIKRVIL